MSVAQHPALAANWHTFYKTLFVARRKVGRGSENADKDIVVTREAPEGESVQTLTADLEGLILRRWMRPSGGGNA